MNDKVRKSYASWQVAALTAVCFGWSIAGASAQVAPDTTQTGAIAPVQSGVVPPAALPSSTTVPLPGTAGANETPAPSTAATVPSTDGTTPSVTPAVDTTTAPAAQPQTEANAAPPAAPLPAACLMSPARLQQAEIDDFIANPGSLLTGFYGQDDISLGNRVRTLSASDARTLDPLLTTVLGSASPAQRAAIGAGLGRAAFSCARASPDLAALIQSRVADLNTGEVLTAFLAATKDFQVAAFGPGGGTTAAAAGLTGNNGAPGTAGGIYEDETVPQTITDYTIPNITFTAPSVSSRQLFSVSGSAF